METLVLIGAVLLVANAIIYRVKAGPELGATVAEHRRIASNSGAGRDDHQGGDGS